jgi:hypothetical protein
MLDRGGPYAPNPRDPLDVEVAAVVGRQPLRIAIERVDPALPRGRTLDPGESVRYRFADGEKVVQCKLVERTGRPVKVMARVGGLWQDLELYLVRPRCSVPSADTPSISLAHSSTPRRRSGDPYHASHACTTMHAAFHPVEADTRPIRGRTTPSRHRAHSRQRTTVSTA